MRRTTIFEVREWLSQLHKLMDEGKGNGPAFLRPYHFVTLALMVKLGARSRLRLPSNLEQYAARMNLWEAAGIEPPHNVRKHDPAGNFLPVQPLRNIGDVQDTAERLAGIAKQQGALPTHIDGISTILMEILSNCHAHASVTKHDLHGLACAQAWPKGNLAQVAIADVGVGIRESLSGNPHLKAGLETENACELATRYGITSKPGAGHSGYGLTLASQLMAQNGGTTIVCSFKEFLYNSKTNMYKGGLERHWPGTLVVLEWSTDKPLDLRSVYDSWPLPEGMADEDFNF